MVDASLRMSIVNLFRQIVEEQGVSLIYITHDLSTAYYLSDQVSIMNTGRVVESGIPTDIFDNFLPVIEMFGTSKFVPVNETDWTNYPSADNYYGGLWWWWSNFKFIAAQLKPVAAQ